MAALGMVSKVYTAKILFPRTWESLANIVEIQNKQTNKPKRLSSCNIHKTNEFLKLAKMAELKLHKLCFQTR